MDEHPTDPTNPPVPHGNGNRARLILSWLWVGVPLAWGVFETLRTSLGLFR